jgi:GNAT superfamily N-acetyltransferase
VHLNAWLGQEHVGSVVFGLDEGTMWVYHLYVKPEHSGKGLGKALMMRVAEAAKQAGRRIGGDFTDDGDTLKAYMNAMLDGLV